MQLPKEVVDMAANIAPTNVGSPTLWFPGGYHEDEVDGVVKIVPSGSPWLGIADSPPDGADDTALAGWFLDVVWSASALPMPARPEHVTDVVHDDSGEISFWSTKDGKPWLVAFFSTKWDVAPGTIEDLPVLGY